MWGKTTERDGTILDALQTTLRHTQGPTPTPAASGALAPGISAIGKSIRLSGKLYSETELYLDGEFEGTLEVRHRLTIGPNGKVKANVKAKELTVRGKIEGDVETVERVIIMNGASIIGDVRTAGIVIEDGAFFKGGIDIQRSQVEKPESTLGPLSTAASVGR
jgi:cytoskeletal protein CcmA (bactofilin family)